MINSKIRWGIVSAGRIAETFAGDMSSVRNGQLIAVAARSSEAARAFARRHGIPKAYGSYNEMFADPDIDAVYIATPHTHHREHAIAAMQAGKAVLCEKPLTTNAAECRELIQSARDTGCYLMEAMWTFFLPAVRQAQTWVDAGRIGRIRHVKADFGYPLPYDPGRREYDARLAGGCLLEMGVYPVALAWLFLRQDPGNIEVLSHQAANGVEDDVVMLFEYPEAVATLATSFRCKLQNWAYIIGEEGYIRIPDFWRASACSLYRLDERVDRFVDERATHGFNFEAEAVAKDLAAGRTQSEVVPWSASLKFQEHMDRVRSKF